MLTPSTHTRSEAAAGQDSAMVSHRRLKEEWQKFSYTAATRSHAVTNHPVTRTNHNTLYRVARNKSFVCF